MKKMQADFLSLYFFQKPNLLWYPSSRSELYPNRLAQRTSVSEIGADATAVESRDFGNGRWLRCRLGFFDEAICLSGFRRVSRKAGQSKRRFISNCLLYV
jgi:hypothetical protein